MPSYSYLLLLVGFLLSCSTICDNKLKYSQQYGINQHAIWMAISSVQIESMVGDLRFCEDNLDCTFSRPDLDSWCHGLALAIKEFREGTEGGAKR